MRRSYLFVILTSLLLVLVACGAGDEGDTQDFGNSDQDVPSKSKPEIENEDQAENNQSKTNSETSSTIEDASLEVHFLDVGQADATLLNYENDGEESHILIDTGDWQSEDLSYYLNDYDIEIIDLLIGTHVHADHIGQLNQVIQQFTVEEVWLTGNEGASQTYDRALAAIEESQANYHEPRAGESYDLNGLEVEVLHPESLTGDYNDDSISVKISLEDSSFLFTGDVEAAGEREMVNREAPLNADVFQLGHHGSSTSNTSEFLNVVDPSIVIYSAGANNSYGHPHEEVIDDVLARDLEVYGTDVHGTISVITDGDSIDLTTQHEGDVIPGTGGEETNNEPPEDSPETESCININEASVEELQTITHIGPDRANQIIELRPFDQVNHMTRINGIGDGRIGDILDENIACVGD
ncbi:MBL fold metallo-hydrolase [Halalkalibacillus halophilus]|uniref:MBL fold metallo-hydrolase n=1 Tax=Halalkalibacillus halophilus TaxID=392827 RepID=UPI0004163897|nr:MBL fold metallo-hydrolase [Halalkalibacillus halophilus]